MDCIICGKPSNLFGTKGEIIVSYCINHLMECVKAKAACVCIDKLPVI